jgi:hypothetical protein
LIPLLYKIFFLALRATGGLEAGMVQSVALDFVFVFYNLFCCRPSYGMAADLPLNLFDCDYENIEWEHDQVTKA